jgi:deazaflavin-dependent oxidoreductase (nitroreductase family)
MADAGGWNAQVIADFRASGGHPGGPMEGSPLVLLHHRGRRSGTEFIAPVMYLADDADAAVIYVFASKQGAPTNPDWYDNLTAAGDGVVEVGSETYPVEVTDLPGPERDRIYAEQARRFPGFAEYEEKTAGIRTIPVLALRRQPG